MEQKEAKIEDLKQRKAAKYKMRYSGASRKTPRPWFVGYEKMG